MKEKTITAIPISRHLIDGAIFLIGKIEKPIDLLNFLTDASCVINYYKGKDSVVYPITIIERIVGPWFESGRDVKKMAVALEELYQAGHYQGYEEFINNLFDALAEDKYEGDRRFYYANVLRNLGQYISLYHEELQISKN